MVTRHASQTNNNFIKPLTANSTWKGFLKHPREQCNIKSCCRLVNFGFPRHLGELLLGLLGPILDYPEAFHGKLRGIVM